VAKKLYYKIGEACKILEIQPYVLRYWEKEFPLLSPNKSKSGQRVYSERELEVIRRIKELLYEEGYTIAGAKKKLEGEVEEDGEPAAKKDAETKDAKDGGKAEAKKSSSEKSSSEKSSSEKLESAEKTEAKKAAAKGSAEKSSASAKSAEPATASAGGTEEAAKLRSGVEEALTQARQILELVGAGSK
jgi:DNA-binding transcriptional MerR regulator